MGNELSPTDPTGPSPLIPLYDFAWGKGWALASLSMKAEPVALPTRRITCHALG